MTPTRRLTTMTLAAEAGPVERPELGAARAFSEGRLRLWQGDLEGARDAFTAALRSVRDSGTTYVALDVLGNLALVQALKGYPRTAQDLVEQRDDLASIGGARRAARSQAALVALAWVRIEEGRVTDAERLVGQAGAAPGHDAVAAPLVALLSARLLRARHELAAAREVLRQARSATLEPAPDWVDAWLAAELEQLVAAAWASARPESAALLAEPLTAKEREVLGHLAELLTTEEIAAAMYVSVNTVRTHVRHILQKLGATRRNEAVRLAWASGLLDRRRDLV